MPHFSHHLQVKGISYSSFQSNHTIPNISIEHRDVYERIWDETDYMIPPAENNAFFIMTNFVITPNQIRSECPEDHLENDAMLCHPDQTSHLTSSKLKPAIGCKVGRVLNDKSHGKETGNCVQSDREKNKKVHACEISGWCPVELDILPNSDQPLIKGTENFTVFIKNSISIPWFDEEKYRRNNMPNGICLFDASDDSTSLCPIFKLGDIVELAGGKCRM